MNVVLFQGDYMNDNTNNTRRKLLKSTAGAGVMALGGSALAQAISFTPNARYPEPALEVLDPSFLKYRIFSSSVEQVASGFRWAEGPTYFPEGG